MFGIFGGQNEEKLINKDIKKRHEVSWDTR